MERYKQQQTDRRSKERAETGELKQTILTQKDRRTRKKKTDNQTT